MLFPPPTASFVFAVLLVFDIGTAGEANNTSSITNTTNTTNKGTYFLFYYTSQILNFILKNKIYTKQKIQTSLIKGCSRQSLSCLFLANYVKERP